MVREVGVVIALLLCLLKFCKACFFCSLLSSDLEHLVWVGLHDELAVVDWLLDGDLEELAVFGDLNVGVITREILNALIEAIIVFSAVNLVRDHIGLRFQETLTVSTFCFNALFSLLVQLTLQVELYGVISRIVFLLVYVLEWRLVFSYFCLCFFHK